MAEYIEREAVKRLVNNNFSGLLAAIDFIPAADVTPVVRCKGCKHSTLPSALTQRYGVPGTLTCHNRYSPCNRRNVGGEDFCSYGTPKNDGGET